MGETIHLLPREVQDNINGAVNKLIQYNVYTDLRRNTIITYKFKLYF